MYKEKIVDSVTGNETWRDYTAAEIAEVEKAKLENEARLLADLEHQAKRQSALNKLIDLGLTEEEIATLQANRRLLK